VGDRGWLGSRKQNWKKRGYDRKDKEMKKRERKKKEKSLDNQPDLLREGIW